MGGKATYARLVEKVEELGERVARLEERVATLGERMEKLERSVSKISNHITKLETVLKFQKILTVATVLIALSSTPHMIQAILTALSLTI